MILIFSSRMTNATLLSRMTSIRMLKMMIIWNYSRPSQRNSSLNIKIMSILQIFNIKTMSNLPSLLKHKRQNQNRMNNLIQLIQIHLYWNQNLKDDTRVRKNNLYVEFSPDVINIIVTG